MSEHVPALVEASKRGITRFELRLDQEAFQRGVEYALTHKTAAESRDDVVPGTKSRRTEGSRYFRGPYSEVYQIRLSPTGRRIVSRWNPLGGHWTMYGRMWADYKVEQFPEI